MKEGMVLFSKDEFSEGPNKYRNGLALAELKPCLNSVLSFSMLPGEFLKLKSIHLKVAESG